MNSETMRQKINNKIMFRTYFNIDYYKLIKLVWFAKNSLHLKKNLQPQYYADAVYYYSTAAPDVEDFLNR